MSTYIGDNDQSTLQGVLELIDQDLKQARNAQAGARTRRESDVATGTIRALNGLKATLDLAAENGRTPDPSTRATA